MPKGLTPKGIEHVEFLLAEMELFDQRMHAGKPLDPNGKAIEIVQLVEECSGRISDALEA